MNFDFSNHEIITENVCRLIKEASFFLHLEMITTSNNYNPSTNVDIEISDYLSKNLILLLDLPVISEESESQYKLLRKNKYVWIIDPLDGTLNALTKNIPFCISVSLVEVDSLKAILTCNYIPFKDELFTAVRGKGAFLNGQKIKIENFERKIISYGLPNDTMKYIEFHLSNLRKVLEEGFITRQSGSAVYDILMTSLGRFHAFYEFGLFIWDFIGADLIATECGCKSFYKKTNNNSRTLRYDYIVSNDEFKLDKLLKLLEL